MASSYYISWPRHKMLRVFHLFGTIEQVKKTSAKQVADERTIEGLREALEVPRISIGLP